MGYQIELRHLHYFSILAEELHFRKAADRLFISQPGLSKQIKHLEEILEVKLLERDNRNVRLTAAGIYLAAEIRQLDIQVEKLVHHTRLIHTGHKGNLKIGYIGSAMQNIIPKLLRKLDADYPGIQFDLTEVGNNEQIDQILHQQIDLGFIRMDQVPQPLQSMPVFFDTFSLVLPSDHPIDTPTIKDLTLIKDEKFILFESSYSTSYYEKVMTIFTDAGFSPRVAHHSIHAGSIYRLVENGFGISIVPSSLKYGYNLKVKFVELSHIRQKAALSALWNPDNRNPIMKHVVKALQENQF